MAVVRYQLLASSWQIEMSRIAENKGGTFALLLTPIECTDGADGEI
jgi:hypothetical protein